MQGNDFVKWLIRSPLHGFISGGVMLITVTGRKSGRPISTPVEYYEMDDTLYVVSGRDRTWWRNLRGGAYVTLRLRGREVKGRGKSILDEKTVAARLSRIIARYPSRARFFGVRVDEGKPNAEDVARVAKERLVIQIRV